MYLQVNDAKVHAEGLSAVETCFKIEALCTPAGSTHPVVEGIDIPFGSLYHGDGQLIPLEELRSANSRYLCNDRLLLRVVVAVTGTVPSE